MTKNLGKGEFAVFTGGESVFQSAALVVYGNAGYAHFHHAGDVFHGRVYQHKVNIVPGLQQADGGAVREFETHGGVEGNVELLLRADGKVQVYVFTTVIFVHQVGDEHVVVEVGAAGHQLSILISIL